MLKDHPIQTRRTRLELFKKNEEKRTRSYEFCLAVGQESEIIESESFWVLPANFKCCNSDTMYFW